MATEAVQPRTQRSITAARILLGLGLGPPEGRHPSEWCPPTAAWSKGTPSTVTRIETNGAPIR
jgi:hypothetical protein